MHLWWIWVLKSSMSHCSWSTIDRVCEYALDPVVSFLRWQIWIYRKHTAKKSQCISHFSSAVPPVKFGLRYDSFMPNHQYTAAAAPIAWDWMKRMRSIVHASRNTHTRWRNSISYIEALTVSGWHWVPCVYRQFHASMRAYTKNRRIANKIGNRFYGHRKLKSGILVIDASIIGRLACAQQHTHCAQLQIV